MDADVIIVGAGPVGLMLAQVALRRGQDAHIAWAAATGEPAGTAAPALREALSRWFGTPGSVQNRPGVPERG